MNGKDHRVFSLVFISPFFLIECLPDGSTFVPESGMSETLAKLKNLIQETQYDETKHEVKFSLPEDSNAMAALDVLGLKIGEKVVVGGVKVSDGTV